MDNPIFHALGSGNKNFSIGNDRAKFFSPDMALFAGIKECSPADFNNLFRISPAESIFILFALAEIQIPETWKATRQMKIVQMVFDRMAPPTATDHSFADLQEQHVPDMLALTKMTNPGPFLPGTIKFGSYRGIFDGTRLMPGNSVSSCAGG